MQYRRQAQKSNLTVSRQARGRPDIDLNTRTITDSERGCNRHGFMHHLADVPLMEKGPRFAEGLLLSRCQMPMQPADKPARRQFLIGSETD
jgi:hypothetical protein